MTEEEWTVEQELMKDFKKGQLVKLNPHGIFDHPWQKDQFAIVIKKQPVAPTYRGRTGVWVWLQKDECKALFDAWDLDIVGAEDAEEID